MKKIRNVISAFFVLAIALIIIWLVLSLRVYQVFNKEELFASVTCQKSSDPSFDYIIFYQPINQKEPAAFGIKGNQWRIEGLIIKWKGFVNILGIHTWHKPVRLSGRFSTLPRFKDILSTEYILNNGEDNFWKFVYKTSKALPLIEAIYGSGTFVPCKEGVVNNVYVSTSGYMIKPKNKRAK